MTWWSISEVSKKTGISVRMLRHFDAIDLLNPSMRQPNSYRAYSDRDIALLEQIIALRYFGFSLRQVKDLITGGSDISAQLRAQRSIIKSKAMMLGDVLETLEQVIERLPKSGSPDSQDLFHLIRRYQMNSNIKSWAKKNLNEKQYKAYVTLYEKHPTEFAKMEEMVNKINKGEVGEPAGEDGEKAVELQQKLIKAMKDTLSEQRFLGADILKSMKAGTITEHQLSCEGSLWMMRASFAYWLKRWNKLYQYIADNNHEDPNGPCGKVAADDWRGLIKQHFAVPPMDLAIGTMLWQEIARQDHDYQNRTLMPNPKELAESIHVKLLFDPKSLQWIEQALLHH